MQPLAQTIFPSSQVRNLLSIWQLCVFLIRRKILLRPSLVPGLRLPQAGEEEELELEPEVRRCGTWAKLA